MIPGKSRNKGYTIIELMVVIVIISILLGLGINGTNNLLQWHRLSKAAVLLSSELKFAQSMAFYSGEYYKIEFWPTLDRYRIYKQTSIVKDIQLDKLDLYNTNFTDNHLYFFPSGVPNQGGTVTLKNLKGKVLYVIMTPVTARIRISSQPPENW